MAASWAGSARAGEGDGVVVVYGLCAGSFILHGLRVYGRLDALDEFVVAGPTTSVPASVQIKNAGRSGLIQRGTKHKQTHLTFFGFIPSFQLTLSE